MPNVVLITGVGSLLGGEVAAILAADPHIGRLIGVDTSPPGPAIEARLGRTEFVRADIGTALITKVIAQAHVDTVVHTAPPSRSRPKCRHVTETLQLLAGCQLSESVRRVVVESSTAVYGASPRAPAACTESMRTTATTAPGKAREAIEVESSVRAFARRRPDIAVTVLRLAEILGPRVETPLSRYLAMPIVPASLGYDPRLQLLHEDDAAEVLRRASTQHHPGVFNVAGDGVVPLSQALRWAGRIRLPVPSRAMSLVGGLVRNRGVVELSAEQAQLLSFGRVVDTSRLREEFGYAPPHSTAATLRSFLDGRPGLPNLPVAVVVGAQRLVQDRIPRVPGIRAVS